MTFFDLLCGTRMHLAIFVICGLLDDFCVFFVDFVYLFIINCTIFFDYLDLFCVCNRLFYLRLRGLSVFDLYDIICFSISGVLSRCTGIIHDLRLLCCYELYFLVFLDFIVCFFGDAFDRFVCRLFDMRMSLLLIKQFLFFIYFLLEFCCFDYFFGGIVIETIICLFYSVF